MLIVDVNTLRAVCILNFSYNIFLNRLGSLSFENILRIFSARDYKVACFYIVALVYKASDSVRNDYLFLGAELVAMYSEKHAS